MQPLRGCNVLRALGQRRVNAITGQDIVGVIKPVWTSKSAESRKALQRLRAVFDWCLAQHRLDLLGRLGRTRRRLSAGDVLHAATSGSRSVDGGVVRTALGVRNLEQVDAGHADGLPHRGRGGGDLRRCSRRVQPRS